MSNDIYFVDANGNTVEEGSAQAAFRINPADGTSTQFVQGLKDGTNMLSQSAQSLHGVEVPSTAKDVQPAPKRQPLVVDDTNAPATFGDKPGK